MEMTKQDRLTKLLNAYSHHYDIERDVDVEGGHFPATAFYYLRDENYLISKKHVLSAIENYEYIYIDLADHQRPRHSSRKLASAKTSDWHSMAGWSIASPQWKLQPTASFPIRPLRKHVSS